MKVEPKLGMCLCELIKDNYVGEIEVMGKLKEKPLRAIVKAVAEGSDYHVGDEILVPRSLTKETELEVDDMKLTPVHEMDIYAKI